MNDGEAAVWLAAVTRRPEVECARVLADVGGVAGLAKGTCAAFWPAAVSERVDAAIALGRATCVLEDTQPVLASSRALAEFLIPLYGAGPVERFGVVILDARHKVRRVEVLTTGTADRSLIHPREVFRTAIVWRGCALVAFHTHPSGDPTPSFDDVCMTRRLVEAGDLIGITVLDSMVITATRYVSLREIGQMG